jgi:hypothetical protein
VTFIFIHSVIIYVVFFGACMRYTRLCSLKPGVTNGHSELRLVCRTPVRSVYGGTRVARCSTDASMITFRDEHSFVVGRLSPIHARGASYTCPTNGLDRPSIFFVF